MKKFLILALAVSLSGCFMYNNLKQSVNCIFDDSACDVEYVTDFDDEKIQKDAENLISDRCLKELKYKNGTIEYMHCSEAYLIMYNYDKEMYDNQTAYFNLLNEVNSQKAVCLKYGIKENSKDFNQCIQEQHSLYVEKRLSHIKIRRDSLTRQLNNKVNMNCQTYSVGNTVYTNCN